MSLWLKHSALLIQQGDVMCKMMIDTATTIGMRRRSDALEHSVQFDTREKKCYNNYRKGKKEKNLSKGDYTLTFETLVKESVQVIVDTCILHDGNCDACELKEFCSSNSPIEYAQSNV